MKHINKFSIYLFFLGSFLTQLGSFTFILGLTYFPKVQGWDQSLIGILLSASYLFPTIALIKWGDLADRISPKKLMIFIEFASILITIGMLISWKNAGSIFQYFFILLVGLKAFLASIQSPARNKYIKLISTSGNSKNMSIVLTAISQGTIFFSAILSWFYFKHHGFEKTIIFDTITFIINGIIILSLPQIESEPQNARSLKERVRIFLGVDRMLFLKDFFASLFIAGISLLMVRISAPYPELTFILGGLFGLSFFVSGLLYKYFHFENKDHFLWVLYSMMFVALAFAGNKSGIILSMLGLFIIYAFLMQMYIARWQTETPKEHIANIFSVRSFILSFTLGAGEIFSGTYSKFITIQHEVILKSLGALVIAFFIYQMNRPKKLTEKAS